MRDLLKAIIRIQNQMDEILTRLNALISKVEEIEKSNTKIQELKPSLPSTQFIKLDEVHTQKKVPVLAMYMVSSIVPELSGTESSLIITK